jgi:hypothetical protein
LVPLLGRDAEEEVRHPRRVQHERVLDLLPHKVCCVGPTHKNVE